MLEQPFESLGDFSDTFFGFRIRKQCVFLALVTNLLAISARRSLVHVHNTLGCHSRVETIEVDLLELLEDKNQLLESFFDGDRDVVPSLHLHSELQFVNAGQRRIRTLHQTWLEMLFSIA